MIKYIIPEGWFPIEVKPDNTRCRNYLYPDGKKIWIAETWHEFMSENVVAWQYTTQLKEIHDDVHDE